jgi:hypothetical protein
LFACTTAEGDGTRGLNSVEAVNGRPDALGRLAARPRGDEADGTGMPTNLSREQIEHAQPLTSSEDQIDQAGRLPVDAEVGTDNDMAIIEARTAAA